MEKKFKHFFRIILFSFLFLILFTGCSENKEDADDEQEILMSVNIVKNTTTNGLKYDDKYMYIEKTNYGTGEVYTSKIKYGGEVKTYHENLWSDENYFYVGESYFHEIENGEVLEYINESIELFQIGDKIYSTAPKVRRGYTKVYQLHRLNSSKEILVTHNFSGLNITLQNDYYKDKILYVISDGSRYYALYAFATGTDFISN